jgi:DNA polymerase III subunit delta
MRRSRRFAVPRRAADTVRPGDCPPRSGAAWTRPLNDHCPLPTAHCYTAGMGRPVHAIDYLASPEKHAPGPVCVVFGADVFLRREALMALRRAVLGDEEGEFCLRSFDGPQADLRDVLDELRTVPMFGGGRRMVVVESADKGRRGKREQKESPKQPNQSQAADESEAPEQEEKGSGFVSRYRAELEQYVAHPSDCGVLVLDLVSFPSNTRLAKAVAASGLTIECSELKEAALAGRLIEWAKRRHALRLDRPAAELLVEMIGLEMGLLDQELAKLAVTVGPKEAVSAEVVSKSAGAWRSRTAWDMLDLALDGNLAAALEQFDRLLAAGEHPVAVLAQIAATLRRLAAATRMVLDAEAAGRRVGLQEALRASGVPAFPTFLQKAERQLRRLTRHRGSQLYRWLLEADLDLKGDSNMSLRLVLERLLVRLAAPTEAVADRGRRD